MFLDLMGTGLNQQKRPEDDSRRISADMPASWSSIAGGNV